MEALLKASEASGLMGVSMRHVRRMAQSGALSYQIHMNAQNRPEYLFPLSSLPDAAQQKYFAEHAPAALPAAAPAKAKKADKPAACKPLEAYTAEERGEIGYWITTVDRWQTYRNKAGTKKAECDEKFVLLCRMEEPDRQISVETLYRKWAAIREGDYGALVDMRGKARKGMSKMPEAIERVFLSLFLDESQLPVPRCIALTEEWAQQNMPEAMPLPGYHTFYRKAKAVPYPVMVLCRMGEKKYYDLCSPYIRREYESISNLTKVMKDTTRWAKETLGLTIKSAWDIIHFASFDAERQQNKRRKAGSHQRTPGLDMMGYVVRRTYTIIRGRNFVKLRRAILRAQRDLDALGYVPWWRAQRIMSQWGEIKHSDSRGFCQKYNVYKIIRAAKRSVSWHSKQLLLKEQAHGAVC